MNDPKQRAYVAQIGGDEHQHEHYIRHINEALADCPEGMKGFMTHMCRGNLVVVGRRGRLRLRRRGALQRPRGGWLLPRVRRRALRQLEPLRFVPKGKQVVLGLVTTKRGDLEQKDEFKRRIDEASQYVPLSSSAFRRSAASPPPSRRTS